MKLTFSVCKKFKFTIFIGGVGCISNYFIFVVGQLWNVSRDSFSRFVRFRVLHLDLFVRFSKKSQSCDSFLHARVCDNMC